MQRKERLGGPRLPHAWELIEPRRVRQQVRRGHGLVVRPRHLESLEILVDVAVEAELSAVGELHDGGGGEELRDGADAEDRRVWRNRELRVDVGESVAL